MHIIGEHISVWQNYNTNINNNLEWSINLANVVILEFHEYNTQILNIKNVNISFLKKLTLEQSDDVQLIGWQIKWPKSKQQ